ncbi:MAG: glycoside hydrolase family 25 protein [Butyrivibrio sp.]|nr:glycoside hydrolase family 25 protein [Butyrivibrio sp.]
MNKTHIKILVGICTGLVICAAIVITLVLTRNININKLIVKSYPVRGIDVSHYQGDIDWEKIESQGVNFAFIKATEGSSHVDECFSDNWQEASKTNIMIGAYHFFSFDSDAKTQAELFINTVGDLKGKITPVIDIEYYGDKNENPPDKEQTVEHIRKMLLILEEEYGTKPIIYTTYKVYKRYIKEEFEDYPLWIRNVYYPPFVDMGNRWTLWQYTDTEQLDGYNGDEEYIDMNVFNGSKEELEKLIIQ